MALKLDLVGKSIEAVPFNYDCDAVIQYALGIGVGTDGEDLDFVYEKRLKVFPTFATIPFMRIFMEDLLPKANIDLLSLLHAEHQVIFQKPIPNEGTIFTTLVWEAVYDKGDKGALLRLRSLTRDAGGELLFENQALFIDRSAGNFGGNRGSKTQWAAPQDGGKPAFRMALDTSAHQAALFRLSGDKNPLHIDPSFAQQAGFARPILHGLCSFGVACRVVLNKLCGNDPTRLKSFGARFVNVVYPGDTLTTEAWYSNPPDTYLWRTTNQDGKTVLGNGTVEILPPND
jgi:acyl dehydratase